MKKIYKVESEFLNTRLDRWFKKKVSDVPQSFIEKNLRKGNIKVNYQKNVSFYKLQKNDVVSINNLKIVPNKTKKRIERYEPNKNELTYTSSLYIENNENFAVINKPPGIAVQSGTKSRKNILDLLRKTKEFINSSPFSVHRIDKETTGVLIIAKNRKYAQLFTSLFRIKKIYKTYLGVVIGNIEKKNGTLIDDLYYYEGDKKIKARAITHFTVIDSKNNYSLLKLNPETGRKHQLRKQLLLYGYPIFGDNKYNLNNKKNNKKSYLMLHAYKIHFKIGNIKYNFSADLPDYFSKFLKEKYLKSY